MNPDQFQKNNMYVETPEAFGEGGKNFDDDGRVKRTGIHTQNTFINHHKTRHTHIYL